MYENATTSCSQVPYMAGSGFIDPVRMSKVDWIYAFMSFSCIFPSEGSLGCARAVYQACSVVAPQFQGVWCCVGPICRSP